MLNMGHVPRLENHPTGAVGDATVRSSSEDAVTVLAPIPTHPPFFSLLLPFSSLLLHQGNEGTTLTLTLPFIQPFCWPVLSCMAVFPSLAPLPALLGTGRLRLGLGPVLGGGSLAHPCRIDGTAYGTVLYLTNRNHLPYCALCSFPSPHLLLVDLLLGLTYAELYSSAKRCFLTLSIISYAFLLPFHRQS